MSENINELLNSLDPETLKALLNSNTDELKKALDDKIVEDKKAKEQECEEANENKPFITRTKTVESRFYYIDIKPEDWIKQDGVWFYTCEVYNDKDQQLREASIIGLSLDEKKMLENADDVEAVNKFIDNVYDNGLIHIKAKNLEAEFEWRAKEKPAYTVCLIIDELPFLDTPASEFGL